MAALLSGDVDMLTDLPTQDVARLRSDSKLKVVDGPEVRTIFLAPDVGSPELKYSNVKGKNPFKDKRVRQALNMAIDREAIKRTIMRGLSIPAGIMVAPGVNGNSADIDVPAKADPDGAKKLLAEAGYPNGFEVQLNCPNNRYVNDEEICQAVVAMWARIGVKASWWPRPWPPSARSSRTSTRRCTCWAGAWPPTTRSTRCSRWSAPAPPAPTATSTSRSISDPEVDALVDAMKTETDVAKRNAMIREALLRISDEVLFDPAAPPDAALGDEDRRDDRAPLGRPSRGALHHAEISPDPQEQTSHLRVACFF